MAHKKERPIESYRHAGKERLNNPPVGLVTPETDPDAGRRTYAYDPHLDPQLHWAGKAEHTSFEVPTVSLHVHERIDPRSIIEAVRKQDAPRPVQLSLFTLPEENPPLRDAIQFYRHKHNWSNRLVAGDSLLVMNSLLEKEGLAGQVQMIYVDPPYGIKYGSNFQPFVNKRDVKDGRDEDLTAEPEQIRAFRDTWELGVHSYLTYLRDRLLLARELLADSGSCFVQISDENVHHVRELMDEVFGKDCFVNEIVLSKTSSATAELVPAINDFILWYAKDKSRIKFKRLFVPRPSPISDPGTKYDQVELSDGSRRPLSTEEKKGIVPLPPDARIYRLSGIDSQTGTENTRFPVQFEGQIFTPSGTRGWSTSLEGFKQLILANRIQRSKNILNYIRYFDDFPYQQIANVWMDIGGAVQSRSDPKIYVVQTGTAPIERCLLMTTDPGDLVFDPTCGSGTTAYVAEQWGRRWITCDTSRVALALARTRLMTAVYDYYELAQPDEGVGSGFRYKTVPHVTLKSIANNEPPAQETLYDQPSVDRSKTRVSGPFTAEAVPAPAVKSVDDILSDAPQATDSSIARSGETLRQAEWRDELLKTGIRGKGGQYIRFARLEPLPGCRLLHSDGETDGGGARRVVVSFGPEHAPLEQRQVETALKEAQTLVPRPELVVFAAFQFDPEAARDIDETNWPGVALLKAQMNADLLTDDLKKKRTGNESFWLIGQPDVTVSSEQWLVDSSGGMVMPYEFCKIVSGADSLAKINALDEGDLRLYAAMAQRGDLWADLADPPGGGLGSGEHRGGPGAVGDGGVHPISGDSPWLAGRIGDTAALVGRLGLHDAGQRRRLVERLRGSRALAQRASSLTLHRPLTTGHYSQVTVLGFDYYNTKTGDLESGGAEKIAVWMLDTDYDGRSLFPRQVFFPMAGPDEGWARLARNLKAEIDPERIEAYRGTVSLPFEPGEHRRVAVKIVDDRGIESLKVMELD